jgi:hypothetical protein
MRNVPIEQSASEIPSMLPLVIESHPECCRLGGWQFGALFFSQID